jgi:hypothetical protein
MPPNALIVPPSRPIAASHGANKPAVTPLYVDGIHVLNGPLVFPRRTERVPASNWANSC